jgi:hypothetical protein
MLKRVQHDDNQKLIGNGFWDFAQNDATGVIPAKAGISEQIFVGDPRLRGDDVRVERKFSMWIFGILGIIVIGCAIAYIYMSRTPEENKGMDSFFGKVKKAAGGIADASANNQKQAPVEKYEKSDDGKVVYAFKDKGSAAKAATAQAQDATEEVKGEEPTDAE